MMLLQFGQMSSGTRRQSRICCSFKTCHLHHLQKTFWRETAYWPCANMHLTRK